MTITATNLGSAHVFANGPYTLSPVASGTDRLQLLVTAGGASNGVQPGVPSVTGRGLTWTLVGSVDYDPAGSTDRATICLWRAIGTPTGGDITVTYAGKTLVMLQWILDEFDGVDTTAPVVQSNTAIGNGLTQSVALAAFADAVNNAAYGCHAHQAGETTTPGVGFTTLANPVGGDGTGANSSTISEWRTGEDTSVDFSWATSRRCGAIAAEISAAEVVEVHEGAVALAGTGTLTAAGAPQPHGDLFLAGAGSIDTAGAPTIDDDLALAGNGDLALTGEPRPVAGELLAGAGALSLSGIPVLTGSLELGGSGSLSLAAEPEAAERVDISVTIGPPRMGSVAVADTRMGSVEVGDSRNGSVVVAAPRAGTLAVAEVRLGSVAVGDTRMGSVDVGDTRTGSVDVGGPRIERGP